MRLIDIEDVALLKTVTDGGLSAKALWRRIIRQPPVDAVPVIRCKDCKWYEFDRKMHCGLPHGVRSKDDYCSDAERKDK